MLFCEDWYKVDKEAMIKHESPQIDDIIRLFSIAVTGDNRDGLLSLVQGKNMTWEEADGTLNCKHSIVARWSLQFNNPSLILEHSPYAKFLSTYYLLNPNNPEQIEVKHN